MRERLQKLISAAGLMSRRAAEKLIREGRVSINGHTACTGEKGDPEADCILIDGEPLSIKQDKLYIMLNKPKGYVTTMSDEKGRKNVSMLVEGAGARLYPVGRLDLNSEGLLIMTNDGDFAHRLMHPSNNVLKTYEVVVEGENLPEAAEILSGTIELDGTSVCAKEVQIIENAGKRSVLLITIGEGKNREVRKMCAFAGLKVIELKRIREGNLELGDLRSGCWRYLRPEEVGSFWEDEA